MRLSKPVLILGIAALLVTACERKVIVIQDRREDLAPRSAVQPEVARRQAAYAIQIGGEKFEIAAKKTGQRFKQGASAGRDPARQ